MAIMAVSGSCQLAEQYQLVINCAARMLPSSGLLPLGRVGQSYPGPVFTVVNGGVLDWTFRNSGQQPMPAGLVLSNDGQLSGTPTTPGVVTLNLIAEFGGCQTGGSYTISIAGSNCPVVTMTPASGPLPPAVIMQAYPPVTFYATGADLSGFSYQAVMLFFPGLTLLPTGVLQGISV
jgi:hypothetical protein